MDTQETKQASGVGMLKWFLVGLVVFAAIVVFFANAVTGARSAALRNSCNCHLKQLGLALLNYESTYHTLPPAYVADADGKPMHSWRVLLLPYLEENDLYQQYRFDEPWDGPNNRKLADKMPSTLRCPAATADSSETSYVVVVGPTTAFPGSQGMRRSDIVDGTSKTIGIVEVVNSGITWLEPRDLTFDEAALGINPKGAKLAISSPHESGAHVGWLDGHVSALPDDFSPESLQALLTAAGREPVNEPQ